MQLELQTGAAAWIKLFFFLLLFLHMKESVQFLKQEDPLSVLCIIAQGTFPASHGFCWSQALDANQKL